MSIEELAGMKVFFSFLFFWFLDGGNQWRNGVKLSLVSRHAAAIRAAAYHRKFELHDIQLESSS